MNIYNELGLKTIINASDTYTKIGGSRMNESVLAAMHSSANNFINIHDLASVICEDIAKITNNESSFISCSCAACIVLASVSAMIKDTPLESEEILTTQDCYKNEFIVFEPQTKIDALPYWKLIKVSGAHVVTCAPSIDDLKVAITDKCAGIWLFAGTMYEEGLPDFKDVIDYAHSVNIPVFVDAAAQLPPFSNLWYYTKELGADATVFSGGKYIKGPQSTGLLVGSSRIADLCRKISSPRMGIGRPYKVGKEDYAAFYKAIKELSQVNESERFELQNQYLNTVKSGLSDLPIELEIIPYGRLGQTAPRLLITMPDIKGSDVSEYLYQHFNPAIDIGFFEESDTTGTDTQIFVNSINLEDEDSEYIVNCLRDAIPTLMAL